MKPQLGRTLVAREPELAVLQEFVGYEASPGALALVGGPGIGKTTLWEAGIAAARERGWRVLSARATGAEARLSFAGLIDLFDGVDNAELADLPRPQLEALRVALLRMVPAAPVGHEVVAVGVLNGLRVLAGTQPLLVAIDDVQWLDSPSAEALTFACRRLADEPVRFLLAVRPGGPTPLERTLERVRMTRLQVGPLSLGALRRLLSERYELSLPRPLMRRIHESTLGNPLFALEIGRLLAERPMAVDGDIPVPDDVEDLLGTRVDGLTAPVRRLLLAVALSGELPMMEATAIAEPGVVEDAVDAGVLVAEGGRVRVSHPLLAAAVKRRSRAEERRTLHRELADVVREQRLRARHLALATQHTDAELATTVAAAAAEAAARCAWREAVELAEHALRLTPSTSSERVDRLLMLADCLDEIGEGQRLTDLLTPELDALPAGSARVRAWLLLSEAGGIRSLQERERRFDTALAECREDPVLRAHVLAMRSSYATAGYVTRIAEVEAWTADALPAARVAGAAVERTALFGLGWARALRGKPIDAVCARFHVASKTTPGIADSPERVAAQRLVWRGELTRARTKLVGLLATADERGEPLTYALYRLHLCEAELRAGDWTAATRLLDEWAESSEGELLLPPMYERCRALLAAGRGHPDETESWATRAIARGRDTGVRWDMLESERALGMAALLRHEPIPAAESLGRVWEHTVREGVAEPGVFPVAPDLVEALVELDRLDSAAAVTNRLRTLAERQRHPWGLATADRCEALLLLTARGDADSAAVTLTRAAGTYDELGLRFDAARSLLALGRALRRHRKWAGARESLEHAAAAFGDLGSTGWAEQARAELDRLGARRPRANGELTPSERRVVELATKGRTNREIALALFVTVHTVEAHLSHVYTKLGVRSRTQLASRYRTDA